MASPLTLGYSLNAFPSETFPEMMSVLRCDVPAVKKAIFPDAPFTVELRFSQQIVDSMLADRRRVSRLRSALNNGGMKLVTINGFVPLSFHKGRVKERAYLPTWNGGGCTRHSRVRFTNDCVSLLAELMDDSLPFGSVSVPAGVLKQNVQKNRLRQTQDAIAEAISCCARHAAEVHRQTGRLVTIGLEPEPGLTCETTDETTEFFERFLWKVLPADLRRYVGVNFDLCHQLVQWEDPLQSLRWLMDYGIPLTKIHLTNAIQIDDPLAPDSAPQLNRLREFYANSKFLHQAVGVNTDGRRVFTALDLPQALSPLGLRRIENAGVRSLRIHYHMPVCEIPGSVISTTLGEVLRFVNGLKSWSGNNHALKDVPLVIETYTWIEQLRERRGSERAALRRCIAEEIRFVSSRLETD